ncbi:MAG: iron ABC transporter permease [Oscillospiraceae bacterium]|nr:iron ABC transporter permease [Oscillospiraceae bacterium]
MKKKQRLILQIMLAVLMIGILVSFSVGQYPVPPDAVVGILAKKAGLPIESFWTGAMETAVWNIRLPRVILSIMVGMSLAAAGGAYQGVFQNPMASPDILGASAGAGFGAALAILLGASSAGIMTGAFGFGMVTVGLVFLVSHRAKGDRILGLVLSGIMISTLFQSGTSFLKLVADPGNQLPQITYWLMGSLSGARWADVGFAVVPMILGWIPLLLLRWQLNVITVGDDEAKTLGIHPQRLRLLIVVFSTLITASAVAVSGIIGWVGLVIPHITRRLVGNDYRYLMPASMMGGGIFLLLVDNLSRSLTASGIPIGILTAFIGAPFFLWMITGKGARDEH